MIQMMQTSEGNRLDMITETTILHAAQAIYTCYHQTHGDKQLPAGVAIDRETLRGHVIFQAQPVLLPRECFVPARKLPQDVSPTP